MKKVVFSAVCCSFIFLIFIWSWLFWYTWTIIIKRTDLSSSADILTKNIISLSSGCGFQRTDKKEIHQDRQVHTGKSCLESSRVYGVVPPHDKFLTIGIPSVHRKKGVYLYKTLKSLVRNLKDDEKDNVTIIILICDSSKFLRTKRSNETYSLFKKEVNSGQILIIEPIWEFYPKMEINRRTFNDSLERVQWRSKQVLDFAFLFHCGQGMAEYFLILEDDIEASPGYVSAIRDFALAKRTQDWISLTFSGFFIIGRLLRNADLSRLSNFLILFHLEKPVDLLIIQFLDILVQDQHIVTRRIPGLFQHNGLFSSLDGKIQKAKDRSFSSSGHISNPPADIVTTLGVYNGHFPEHCYIASTDQFFWGTAPKVNDTMDIVLHRPVQLKRLFIISGHPLHKNDFIRYANIKLSSSFKQMVTNNKAECLKFHTVDYFHNGIVDISFSNPSKVFVQCIRIEFVKKHSNWIVIREIVVHGEGI